LHGSKSQETEIFWREFTSPGPLKARNDGTPMAHLEIHATVAAGARRRFRFLLTWNKPLRQAGKSSWSNYFHTIFANSTDSARYCLKEWDRLATESKLFQNTIFSSTLPPEVLDAVTSTLAVLKSPTVIRLQDGSFWGWDGSQDTAGSC
jgi:uncharacterized protein (DUF608 family)